jgi:N-acetylglucosamine kinase-like BadF-type ATPase
MELFTKQADCRIEKSKLYSIIMDQFKLQDEMYFIDLMEKEYIPKRSKVASLQRILLQAAQAGDLSAIGLYHNAADELFMLIHSVAIQLDLIGRAFEVSYSGGLFHAKEFILPYLECMTKTIGGRLSEPLFTPVQGAALQAVSMFSNIPLEIVQHNLCK